MESLVQRKRFLFRNSSEDSRQIQFRSKEQQAYEESTQIINQMIINVRTLLYRTKTIKQDIQHTKQPQSVTALQSKIQEYKKFQKSLQRPFFSSIPLDQSMTGAFVMRLCREVSYWATVLLFVIDIVDEIDKVFCEQKKTNELSIELIYFSAIKKINSKTDELIKISYEKMMGSFNSQNEEELQKSQSAAVFDLISLLAQQRDKNLAKMKEMQEYMNKMISRTYKGLQIVSFEPIRMYKADMSQDFNLSELLKKQLKRNKKLKKQLVEFDESYNFYKKKRLNRVSSFVKIEPRTSNLTKSSNSMIKASLKSLVSIKDSVIRQETKNKVKLPILAPSRFDNQQSITNSLSKHKKNNREPIYSSSKQKNKPKNNEKKQNRFGTKSRKLKL